MKNIFNLSLLSGLFVFFSCEKDEERAYLISSPGAPDITSPANGTVQVLSVADSAMELTFDWSAADYGFPAEVLYALQVDKAGNNFAEPVNVATVTSETTASIITYELNNKLLGMGLNFGQESDVELRLRAVVNGINSSSFTDTVYSEAITMTFTPFEVIIIYPKLYVPGSYQGWNFGPTVDFVYDVGSNDRYEGYIWFPDATTTFKFTRIPDWVQNQTIGDAVSGGTSGTLVVGDWGNDISVVGGPGYFKINANLDQATYSYIMTDWGLVGSATGSWDVDKDMTYDIATETWSITTDLIAGEIKFRANDDWAINYGDDGLNGRLEFNGANIPVAEDGNYTITLDLSEALYSYTVVKN